MPPRGRKPSQPARLHTVRLRVSRDILNQLLRLDRCVTIVDANYDPDTTVLTLELDIPNRPQGAEELLLNYRRLPGRDPITCTTSWKIAEPATVVPLPVVEEDAA